MFVKIGVCIAKWCLMKMGLRQASHAKETINEF